MLKSEIRQKETMSRDERTSLLLHAWNCALLGPSLTMWLTSSRLAVPTKNLNLTHDGHVSRFHLKLTADVMLE